MIPIGRDNPTKRFPVVTATIVGLNVLVFLTVNTNPAGERIMAPFMLIPAQPTLPGLFGHQFLHANIEHIFGNMLVLWVFGPNVEDLMGRAVFPFFYLACGLVAAAAHIASQAGTLGAYMTMVGASGAIAGISGAYMVLFPLSKIRMFPLVFIPIPAYVVLGFWMYLQIASQRAMGASAGVAFMAHIGGFAFGAGILYTLMLFKIIVVPHYDKVKRGEYTQLDTEDEFEEKLRVARDTGRSDALVRDYARLVTEKPSERLSADTLLEIGHVMLKSARPDLAVTALRSLMQWNPDIPHAQRAAIEVPRIALQHFKSPRDSIQYLQWAIQADPQSQMAAMARAEIQRISFYLQSG